MSKVGYRKDIDGLRALAVLPVVMNHAGLPGFPGGFVGVDIFFVISGFLITRILAQEIEQRRFSVLGFYERRARRILPALFAVLFSTLIGGWFLLPPDAYASLGKSMLATLMFASNIWFWHSAGDYFGPDVEFEPLLHTWSLAVEEQFYLLFPLLLLLIARRPKAAWITVVAVLSLVSFLVSVWLTRAAPTANFYLAMGRAWELGAGALLALGAVPAARSGRVHAVAGWAGLALIGGSIAFIDGQTPFPGLAALPPVAGAVLLIFAGSAPQPALASRIAGWRPLVWIGLISYSLYLWHWPVIVAARFLTDSSLLAVPVAALTVLLSLGLACLSWRFIELPFRARRGERVLSARWILAFSSAGAAALAGGAFVVWSQDGILGQFSSQRVAAYERAIKRSALDVACMNLPETEPPCRIGAAADTGAPARVVVWGDSHAGATLAGFDAWLASREVNGLAFVKAACPPILGVRRVDQASDHNCDTHNDSVLAQIEANPDIRQVILFGRWALSTEGTRAAHEPGGPAILAEHGADSLGISDNARLVADGLDRVVARLRAREIDVVLVGGLPEIGRGVPQVVLRYGSDVGGRNLLPTRADYDARNLRANQIIEAVTERRGSVYLDPARLLCGETCRVEIDGDALYRDDDHMSEFGARWLVPRLFATVAIPTVAPAPFDSE